MGESGFSAPSSSLCSTCQDHWDRKAARPLQPQASEAAAVHTGLLPKEPQATCMEERDRERACWREGRRRGEGRRERGRRTKKKEKKKEKKPFLIELNSRKKIPRGNCLSSNFKEMTFRQLASGAFLPLPDIHHHFSLFNLLLPLVPSSGKQGPSGTSFCPPPGSAEHCLLHDVTLGNR